MTRRRLHLTTGLITLALSLACNRGSAPSKEVDAIAVEPTALARELATDRNAAQKKYTDKWVQFSGTVRNLKPPQGMNDTQGIGLAELDPKLAFDGSMSLIFIDNGHPEDVERYKALKVGDAFTVRCKVKFLGTMTTLVGDCRFAG